MVTKAVKGEIGICYRCGGVDILDGWGRCVKCYDAEIDSKDIPIYTSHATPEKKAEWAKRYYQKHRKACNQRAAEYLRRWRTSHPELTKIIDKESYRQHRAKTRHPCIDCGGDCFGKSKRCRRCYFVLLRTKEKNHWRISFGSPNRWLVENKGVK